MTRILPLIILALVTFAVVWLFMQNPDTDGNEVRLRERKSPFESNGREPFQLSQRDPKNHEGVEKESIPIPEEEVKQGFGKIVVLAKLPDGSTPQALRVVFKPDLPAPESVPGGFALDEVPAGRYTVSLLGGDIIPIPYRTVIVKDGKESRLKFKVLRGIRPKGRVLDASDNTPIANAKIDFNGMAQAVSDLEGYFAINKLIPRRALDVITVANEDYGSIPFKGLVIPDIGSMKLYLGGGKGVVHCEIITPTGEELPKNAFLRVTLPPLYENRREVQLEGRAHVTVRKMYQGTFRFELHFPDGEFPTQRQLVEIPGWTPVKEPVLEIRFILNQGITLQGKFKAPAKFTSGMVLQLRDLRNHVVAQAKVDPQGGYQIKNLDAGEYVPVVMSGGKPVGQLPLITIEGSGVVNRDVDILRKKWAK